MKDILLIICFSALTYSCSKHSDNPQDSNYDKYSDYNEFYNLEFNMDEGWFGKWSFGSAFESYHIALRIDSADILLPLQFYQMHYERNNVKYRERFKLPLCLGDKILLPKIPKKELEVSLTCKSQNLKPINLIISGFDDEENRLLPDTLMIPSENIWQKYTKKVNANNCRYICFDIIAEGTNDTYDYEIMPLNETNDQYLWLDKIEITIDGKNIKQFSLSDAIGDYKIKRKNIIPVTNDGSFDNIKLFNEKRILAIGESVHGSESFNKIANQIIKYQVEHNNCKLVLIELFIEQTLSMNRFIQGDDSLNVDTLLYDIRNHCFSYAQIKDLLLWLKSYNQTTDNKVWLMGFDSECWNDRGALYINVANYLCDLNKKLNNPIIDSVCYELMYSESYTERYYKEPIRKLKSNEKIKELIGEKEFQILIHSLEALTKVKNMGSNDFMRREKILFDNAQFMIDLICSPKESVVVYGHFCHINYKYSEKLIYSFGHYMKQYYHDQYSGICMLAAQGEIFSLSTDFILAAYPLQQPPKNSLENGLFTQTSEDCNFIPVEALSNSYAMIRDIGFYNLKDIFPIISHKNRIDAFLFIRESEACTKLPGIANSRFDYNAYMDEKNTNVNQKMRPRLINVGLKK